MAVPVDMECPLIIRGNDSTELRYLFNSSYVRNSSRSSMDRFLQNLYMELHLREQSAGRGLSTRAALLSLSKSVSPPCVGVIRQRLITATRWAGTTAGRSRRRPSVHAAPTAPGPRPRAPGDAAAPPAADGSAAPSANELRRAPSRCITRADARRRPAARRRRKRERSRGRRHALTAAII